MRLVILNCLSSLQSNPGALISPLSLSSLSISYALMNLKFWSTILDGFKIFGSFRLTQRCEILEFESSISPYPKFLRFLWYDMKILFIYPLSITLGLKLLETKIIWKLTACLSVKGDFEQYIYIYMHICMCVYIYKHTQLEIYRNLLNHISNIRGKKSTFTIHKRWLKFSISRIR